MSSGEFLPPWTPGENKDYSDNKSYNVGNTIQFAWSGCPDNSDLALVQDNHPGDATGGPQATIQQNVQDTSYTWTVSYLGLDPSYNNVYYLGVGDCFSHYFNITDETATPTLIPSYSSSSSTSTPSQTSTQAQSSTSVTTPLTTTTVTSSNNTNGGGAGTDTGTIAGIAVGVVVGVLCLAAALWWGWKTVLERRSRRKAAGFPPSSSDPATTEGVREQGQVPPVLLSLGGGGGHMSGMATHYLGVDGKLYPLPTQAGGNQIYEGYGQPLYEVANTEVVR